MDIQKQKTLESYNTNASVHVNRWNSVMKEIAIRKENVKFVELVPGKKVLDLGCGNGDHGLYFQGEGLDVTAIDFSESMVENCRKRGLNAEIMNIESLTFADETFDGIWSAVSLLHIPKKNIPTVLEKLQVILRPNGILYICVKEGEGERMVPDGIGTTERFFAFWQLDELRTAVEPYFEYIPFDDERLEVVGRKFVQLFFKKT